MFPGHTSVTPSRWERRSRREKGRKNSIEIELSRGSSVGLVPRSFLLMGAV